MGISNSGVSGTSEENAREPADNPPYRSRSSENPQFMHTTRYGEIISCQASPNNGCSHGVPFGVLCADPILYTDISTLLAPTRTGLRPHPSRGVRRGRRDADPVPTTF